MLKRLHALAYLWASATTLRLNKVLGEFIGGYKNGKNN